MKGVYDKIGTLSKGHVLGETKLDKINDNLVFRRHLEKRIDEVTAELIRQGIEITRKKGLDNVGQLRSRLSKDPKALGLDDETTATLCGLFLDVRSAVEYKRQK